MRRPSHKLARVAIGRSTAMCLRDPLSDADRIMAFHRPRNDRQERLWLLATLPPPINGQSNCNAAMLRWLGAIFTVRVLGLGTTAVGKIGRAMVNAWTLLLHARGTDTAFLSPPGQNGAWLLLPAIVALRLRGVTMWFHHHSFRAINLAPLPIMKVLIIAAGPRQHHVLLSGGMRDRFAALYLGGESGRAHVLSNAFLFPPKASAALPQRPDRPLTLGHVSVLTREKGILYLLDLFEALRSRITDLRLVIAGPSRDKMLLQAIEAAQIRHHGDIEYRGLIDDAGKSSFYRDVDLFILPTTLVDEAEPLVMLEAYAQGVDVYATNTGCIADRIRTADRLLSLDIEADVARIVADAPTSGKAWDARRRDCVAHAGSVAAEGVVQGVTLLARLEGDAAALKAEAAAT